MGDATGAQLSTACETEWDVVVVGAGVAGAYVAAHLAHFGARTLLVERDQFPRDKVCGCCLNDRAIAALVESPLEGERQLVRAAQPLAGMRLGAGGRTAELRFSAGMALSRHLLDAGLVKVAAEAGVKVMHGVQARWQEENASWAVLKLQDQLGEVEVRARLIVAADGLSSQLLAGATGETPTIKQGSLIGAGVVLAGKGIESFEPGLIHMACGFGGYVGLVRLEDGRLDLAMACEADAVKQAGGLGALAGKLLREAGWPEPEGMLDARWRGTPRLTRNPVKKGTPRLASVGDAGGYIEPFTGEGMGWALAGAHAQLPGLIARALGKDGVIYKHSGIGLRGMACRASAALLRHPRLVGWTVDWLRFAPWSAKPVAWLTGRGKRWRLDEDDSGLIGGDN